MKTAQVVAISGLLAICILLGACGVKGEATLPPPTSVPTKVATELPRPTATGVPTATPVLPVWQVAAEFASPFTYSANDGLYHNEQIDDSAIVLDANTRWSMDIQVDNLSKVDHSTYSGMWFYGNGTSTRYQYLELLYANGTWNLAYYDYAISKKGGGEPPPVFWKTLESLDDPKQHFELFVARPRGVSYLWTSKGDYAIDPSVDIFDQSDIIISAVQASPRNRTTVSGLKIEQSRVPSMVSLISLKEPYVLNFDHLDINEPNDIFPFAAPAKIDMFGHLPPWFERNLKVQGWALDSRAHSGLVAINAIPGGNPGNTDGMTGLTMSVLSAVFDVSGYEQVDVSLWINTTSNPRRASVHNCDSSLELFYRVDENPLAVNRIFCGEYKKESQGWHQASAVIDVRGKSTIQLAFGYSLQQSFKPDPSTYFLIDDVEVSAK